MNLIVKDLLYGPRKRKGKWCQNKNIDEDKDEDGDMESADVLEGNEKESEKIEAERRHWCVLGVVGKAYNIVIWVHSKLQHYSAWIN